MVANSMVRHLVKECNSPESSAETVIGLLSQYKFIICDEKKLQMQIEKVFISNEVEYLKEYPLDNYGVVDFFVNGLAIEVKIKGRKKSIYKQCLDYCQHKQVNEFLLVTNMSMGMPELLNEKPCYVLSLGMMHL